ncbi:DUF3168 domain-containing protein [Nitrobacter sp. TKz-YC01]|uniref:DUF3168 domain-containing protein n=1 Tax=Nitrobacter sp. TKz-YC01 TaxID=3398703 RepID=UPI003A0FE82A
MASPSHELQVAIVNRLKADATLAALVGSRVYDHVPRGAGGAVTADFPFVGIADSDDLQDDATCVTGYEITMNLDVWSRKPGFVEAKQIAHAVVKSLHNWDASLPTHKVITLQHRQTRIFRDPDGLTSHGVVEMVAIVTE